MQFDTRVGCGKKLITVDFCIDKFGDFEYFYVIASFPDGPQDIKAYLSTLQIEYLQYKAQIIHREQAVDRNEQEIVMGQTADGEWE